MDEKRERIENNKDILIENGKIVQIGEKLEVKDGIIMVVLSKYWF